MVLIAQSIQRRVANWTAGVCFPVVAGIFLLHSVHPGSGTQPTSYPIGAGGSFREVKRPGREADHTFPIGAEGKIDGAISPLPKTSS
jgi:hypothetical protein